MVQVMYAIALLVSSAGALILEIVAGRLLAPYVGMSLYTWTAIIAVVLAGLSIGHWIGGRLAAPHVDRRIGGWRIAWSLALAAFSTLACLVMLRQLSQLLLHSGLGMIETIVALATALFFLPSLFVGVVSPILTKLAVDAGGHHPGAIIGRMFALGTLGSIAGTLLAGYVFISWIGSTGTVIMVAAAYAALAVMFALMDRVHLRHAAIWIFAMGTVTVMGVKTQAFTNPCDRESDYFCIRMAPYEAVPGTKLMALDHLIHSINAKDDPTLYISPYIHFVDEYVHVKWNGDAVENAYFIGGGGFTLPRGWAHEFGERANLVVAEIDPAVTQAARDGLWFDPNAPGISVVHEDARMYLQSLPAQPTFDVVFGDAFHDITVPPHLVTREFTEAVARRLNPDGIYAVNVVDNGQNPRFMLSLARTLGTQFATVEAWAERGELGRMGRVTYVLVASNRPNDRQRLTSRRGPERTWIRWPDSNLRARALAAGIPVLTDNFAPVDRLMRDLLVSHSE